MNNFKLVSSKQLIGELYSDFNITNDDWVNKAQRFMARALGLMRIDGYYEKALHIADVEEYMALLPCDSKYILTVLAKIDGVVKRLPLTQSLALGMDFSQVATHSIYQGGINNNALHTNFPEGKVLYIYYRIPKDEEDNLMIPDNDEVFEALPFYIIYRLSLSGYKHPVIDIKFAYDKWMELYPRARNRMNYPSIEDMHRLAQVHNNPLFINIIDEEWNTGYDALLSDSNNLTL